MIGALDHTHPKRILVVEDNADVADVVRGVLSSYGYSVETADDLSLFQASREHLPDVILLDVLMPFMSGVEAARQLKQSPETSSIPIVLMSAAGDLARCAAEVGAVGYLHKPFSLDELLAVIEQAIAAGDYLK